ncbi:MAG: hypothetical protein J1F35_05770 [Erysipelotrichales bacterium]|nr:hypothetical protein [Erysipelotrichales bacterium]
MRKKTYLDTRLVHVYQNDKITVAKCHCYINLDQLPVDRVSLQGVILKYFPMIDFNGEFDVVGKSRRNAEDEFDTNIGLYLAESKAQQKAYDIANKFYAKIKTIILDSLNEVELLERNTKSCKEHCREHIVELGKIN